jgi:hypothetical protein
MGESGWDFWGAKICNTDLRDESWRYRRENVPRMANSKHTNKQTLELRL